MMNVLFESIGEGATLLQVLVIGALLGAAVMYLMKSVVEVINTEVGFDE